MNRELDVMGMSFLSLIAMVFFNGFTAQMVPLGLPPGERDVALQRVPTEGVLLYSEWTAQGPGKAGAAGIEGLIVDEEIQMLLDDVEVAIATSLEKERAPKEIQLLPKFVRTLVTRPGCLFVSTGSEPLPERAEEINPGVALTRLQVGLVINGGEHADDLESQILGFLEAGQLGSQKELDHFVLPIPIPVGPVTLHRDGDHLILGVGADVLEGIVERLHADKGGIADDAEIQEALALVKQERTGRYQYVDVKRIAQFANAIAGDRAQVNETLEMLHLDQLGHIVLTTGLADDGAVLSRTHIATGGGTDGVLSVLAGRPLTPKDFAHIPADSDSYIAKSVDLAKILAESRKIIEAVDPDSAEQFAQGLAELDAELGISVEKDIPAAFGSVWTVYNAPSNGGLVASSPVLALEVLDAEKAYTIFSQFMKTLKANLPGDYGGGYRRRGVYLVDRKFHDHTIYFVNTVGDDVPFAPAFCVTDTHLLITLHPQAMKGHLRLVDAGGENLSSKLPADVFAGREQLVYGGSDPQGITRLVTAFAPYFMQLAMSEMQREGFPLDLFSLPSARGLLPYATDSSVSIERTKEGLLIEVRDGMPIPGLSSSAILLPAATFGTFVARQPVEFEAPAVEIQRAVPAEID